eukprot:Em0003g1581a
MVQARIDAHKTSHGGALPDSFLGIYSREPNRKCSIFIGNLTWWTTDQDIIVAVRDAGLKEVKALKFFENRANGQSKGYVLAELESELLSIAAVDKLPEVTVHSQKPLVMHAAKLSPHQFESKCQLPSGSGITSGSVEKSTSASSLGGGSLGGGSSSGGVARAPKVSTGVSVSGTGSIRPSISLPGLPPLPPGLAAVLRPPAGILPDPSAFQGGLPPFPPIGMHHLNPLNFRPPGFPHLPGFDPSLFRAGAAAPHLNPAFLQEGGNMAELFAQAAARFKNQAAALSGMNNAQKMASEEEANDANHRNRAISSSAITRAVADANAGDFDSAIDTLHMAINLIKQSVTANTETSLILIQSLQDCLGGIENQEASRRSRSGSNGGGHEHRRLHDDRDGERSRGGHRSSRHHRDRSRERDRERDREHRR